jgi:thymidine phosphorylase
VGLSGVAERGQWLEAGAALAIVHARTATDAERAAAQVLAAFTLGEAAPAAVPAWRWL